MQNSLIHEWNEITITLTLISLGVVAFGLAAKFLPLFPERRHAHA